ncbi:hypothetical protein HPP92_001499 [Vanilla planifolia]|uniref:Dof zinc finger protein n=1 Tax=Vanilla planifolia TaxID=51239 RepID=A0A835VJQ7_VANPL|nr:hypothetical protein HPP92_001499 [Vanilla planifolia]
MERRHQQAEKEPRKGKTAVTSTAARQAEPPRKCPRCESSNTKFCYYNNYSSSQPRYFCRACRRYWTEGGTLRNLPHGGSSAATARRASKFSKRPTASNSSSAIATMAMGGAVYSAPAPGSLCLPPRLTHEPLYFARGGFVRHASGYPAVEPELLAGVSLPTSLPRLAGVVNPSLVLGPPARPQILSLPMERFTDSEAAADEEDRLFNDLLGGFQECSGGVASASRPPPASSGPFI